MFTEEGLDAYLDLQDDICRLLSLYQALDHRQAARKVASIKEEQKAVRADYARQIERVVAGLSDASQQHVPDTSLNTLLHRWLPQPALLDIRDALKEKTR